MQPTRLLSGQNKKFLFVLKPKRASGRNTLARLACGHRKAWSTSPGRKTLTGELLTADDVDAISYTAYKLGNQFDNSSKTPIEGHTEATVPIEITVRYELQSNPYWEEEKDLLGKKEKTMFKKHVINSFLSPIREKHRCSKRRTLMRSPF